MATLKSLNVHPTQILGLNTPVEIISNPAGRDVFVFKGENIEDYILIQFPKSEAPTPQVGSTEPQEETLVVQGGVQIPVQVSSGTQISNLPEKEEGVVWVTSYPTAKAAAEIGRSDFVNAGPIVYKSYDPETGRGSTILGCLGVNRFA